MTKPTDKGALSRLIIDANADASFAQMEKRAVDSETGDILISRSQLNKFARGVAPHAPTPAEIRGIALAIRGPIAVVQKAVAEQYVGYVATELSGYDSDIRRIVGHLESMPADEVRRWRAMMEAAEQVRHDR